jgi:hypothetical protein
MLCLCEVGCMGRADGRQPDGELHRRPDRREHAVKLGHVKSGPLVLALVAAIAGGCGGPFVPTPTPTVAPSSTMVATPGPTSSSPAPAASPTAVTDRYPDGLPRTIGGAPVLRGAAALADAGAATDDTRFLIAGWVSWVPGPRFCPAFDDGSTWLRDCGRPALSDLAGAQDPALSAAVTFRFVLDQVATGPVVAQVRVHDPRASTCGAAAAQCDRMMAVLRIVWAGDAATTARPRSLAAVQRALGGLHASATIVARGSDRSDPCGNDLAGADIAFLTAPPRNWPLVTTIEIEPSVAARQRALSVPAGASGALTSAALVSTAFNGTPSGSWSEECRWLAVANVALVVRTHHAPTAADRAFLVRLAAALEGAAASGA